MVMITLSSQTIQIDTETDKNVSNVVADTAVTCRDFDLDTIDWRWLIVSNHTRVLVIMTKVLWESKSAGCDEFKYILDYNVFLFHDLMVTRQARVNLKSQHW